MLQCDIEWEKLRSWSLVKGNNQYVLSMSIYSHAKVSLN